MAIHSPAPQRSPGTFILAVPYSEKDEARAMGARWDANQRVWVVPAGKDAGAFSKWFPIPDLQFRADRQRPPRERVRLYVDMVPQSAWYSNLRSEITAAEWTLLKRKTADAAGSCCEACDERGPQWPVECHERWTFDEETLVQTLDRTVAFCPDCHEATHYGLATLNGRDGEARNQLMRVTGMIPAQVAQHVRQAGEDWQRRSRMTWALDARWLLEYIPLSEETRTKILAHAAGVIDRFTDTQDDEDVRRHRQRG